MSDLFLKVMVFTDVVAIVDSLHWLSVKAWLNQLLIKFIVVTLDSKLKGLN
jgi:hypothetical protein